MLHLYFVGESDINFVFPPKNSDEEELHLYFNWAPAYMSRLANPASKAPTPELIMFALPHHQERIMPTSNSSNKVQYAGCIPTLHGRACLIQGSSWCLLEHLHRIGFNAPRPPRPEMVESIRSALLTDLTYQLPTNYKNGAGDTYFSGKMLAKLARIILIADEVKGVDEELVAGAMRTLQDGVETWIGGTGFTPLLYYRDWGGIISCGCLFDGETQGCFNQYPDCPALENMGLNFGAGDDYLKHQRNFLI
jgi:endoglucanase Acf2